MAYELTSTIQKLGESIQPEQLRYYRKRVLITKEFTFDAAHHLHAYEGKCKELHGHTYRLQVTVQARPNEIGLGVDFSVIKRIVKAAVVDRLDHHYLNTTLPPMNTTAENMIVWMYEQIVMAMQKEQIEATLERLILHETPTSSVEITREAMEDNE